MMRISSNLAPVTNFLETMSSRHEHYVIEAKICPFVFFQNSTAVELITIAEAIGIIISNAMCRDSEKNVIECHQCH